VTGTPLRGRPLVWREWEAELVGGDAGLLDAVGVALQAAGATLSGSGSKVGRVLADRRVDTARWGPARIGPGTSAGAVAIGHLREQVEELVRRDPQVRQDLPDSVHKMRVATRRLRSALQTFRPFLHREVTDSLREELRWLAGVLGEARDAEVMHERLRALVAAEEEVVGPVQQRIDTVFTGRYRVAHDRVLRTLDTIRYLRLLDRLEALVSDPPVTAEAYARATKVLPAVVAKAWKRLDRELDVAVAQEPGHARDLMLHEARKDAKRARYVTEAVIGVFGDVARTSAKAATRLQEALGEHQDGVVTRAALRELAGVAHRAGEPTFTYGRLHALEQTFADGPDATRPAARAAAAKNKVMDWFSKTRRGLRSQRSSRPFRSIVSTRGSRCESGAVAPL
ncbi:MAG: domain containing protein, partial [Frankiales bacterium]|nr:domain containing protein [Frankiales bacterium]